MLHIRKFLSKKEKQEYKEWLEKHKTKISKESIERLNKIRLQKSINDPRIREISSNVSQTPFLSRLEALHPETAKATQKYDDPEMVQREALAQREIALKRQRTAPLFNKGGYQFISDEMDLKTIGKKV